MCLTQPKKRRRRQRRRRCKRYTQICTDVRRMIHDSLAPTIPNISNRVINIYNSLAPKVWCGDNRVGGKALDWQRAARYLCNGIMEYVNYVQKCFNKMLNAWTSALPQRGERVETVCRIWRQIKCECIQKQFRNSADANAEVAKNVLANVCKDAENLVTSIGISLIWIGLWRGETAAKLFFENRKWKFASNLHEFRTMTENR